MHAREASSEELKSLTSMMEFSRSCTAYHRFIRLFRYAQELVSHHSLQTRKQIFVIRVSMVDS